MRRNIAKLTILVPAFVMFTHPALAQISGSDACSTATGGACNATAPSGPVVIPEPEIARSGAYISQIGDDNRAEIRQSSTRHFASIIQNGDQGSAEAHQSGDGNAYLEVDQAGLLNEIVVNQDGGSGASNTAIAAQQGEQNLIILNQSASAGDFNGALLAQQGNGNQIQLDQNGAGNRAALVQNGDNNAMTAVQNGNANQLQWIQQGSGLSDLQITQSGGQAIAITQSNGGS